MLGCWLLVEAVLTFSILYHLEKRKEGKRKLSVAPDWARVRVHVHLVAKWIDHLFFFFLFPQCSKTVHVQNVPCSHVRRQKACSTPSDAPRRIRPIILTFLTFPYFPLSGVFPSIPSWWSHSVETVELWTPLIHHGFDLTRVAQLASFRRQRRVILHTAVSPSNSLLACAVGSPSHRGACWGGWQIARLPGFPVALLILYPFITCQPSPAVTLDIKHRDPAAVPAQEHRLLSCFLL